MAINKMMLAALKALSYPDIDVKKHYKLMRRAIGAVNRPYHKSIYKVWDHKILAEDHEIPIRIFTPENSPEQKLLIFFHGGGWVTGNIDSYNKVCTDMAKFTNHIVVSVDYRLAPEYRFPAAPEDCYFATREIFKNAGSFKTRPDQITLIGDSAGGNLAAVVSQMARDRGEFQIKRQILIYPATYNNHTESSPFASVHENGTDYLLTSKRICDYMLLYQSKKEDIYNPYFAPLLALDLSNQPDTLIITAEFDPLRDEGEMYARRLKNEGNHVVLRRIPDALHGFFSLSPRFSQVQDAYDSINRFLERN